MREHGLTRVLRVFFGLLTLAALIRQLAIHVSLGFNLTNFFSYYTILSNLFAGCVLILSATCPLAGRWMEMLRFIAVVNMVLVGLVFGALLRNTDLGQILPWVNFVHHYLMPCVLLADWLIVPPKKRLEPRELFVALSFPLGYLVYSLARGRWVGWYPYPFLNASLVGGVRGVAVYAAGITVAFCVIGALLLLIGNRRCPEMPAS